MRVINTLLVLLAWNFAQAQYNLKIEISALPQNTITPEIFIAGNFNNWNPHDNRYSISRNETGKFSLIIKNMNSGSYEFKFTRGSWNTVETDSAGNDIQNRQLTISGDTTISFSVAGWKDFSLKNTKRKSTASLQVHILDTAFKLIQLNTTRRIWIYLPKNYSTSGLRYPVLYLHDGQNLFEDSTSFAGEWGIDEALDSLKNAGIVVGIENGGAKRMNEYNPNDTKQFGKGEGKEYLEFIVRSLKPYIDQHYRTNPDNYHTAIAGSSMGGLISFYAGIYYPDVFEYIGVFSPSFWLVPELKSQMNTQIKKVTTGKQHYFFYAGVMESGSMVSDMESIMDALKTLAHPAIMEIVAPQGKHNEASWRKVFPEFYKWISSGKRN